MAERPAWYKEARAWLDGWAVGVALVHEHQDVDVHKDDARLVADARCRMCDNGWQGHAPVPPDAGWIGENLR